MDEDQVAKAVKELLDMEKESLGMKDDEEDEEEEGGCDYDPESSELPDAIEKQLRVYIPEMTSFDVGTDEENEADTFNVGGKHFYYEINLFDSDERAYDEGVRSAGEYYAEAIYKAYKKQKDDNEDPYYHAVVLHLDV